MMNQIARKRMNHDPLKEILRVFEAEFPSMLASSMSSFAPSGGPGISVFDFNPHAFTPLSETFHDGEDFVIKVELPGVSSENVNVELDNNRIIISGEKKDEHVDESEARKLREIRYGSFKRVYPVPTRVNSESIEANFNEGILTVRVKDALKKSEGIKIEIN